MSRSYKKVYGTKDGGNGYKKIHSRRLRRKGWRYVMGSYGAYKKHGDQYDICDWKCIDFGSEYAVFLKRKEWNIQRMNTWWSLYVDFDSDEDILNKVKKSNRK